MLFKPVLRMLSAAVAVALASGSAFADEPKPAKPIKANDVVDAAIFQVGKAVMEYAANENLPSIGVLKVMVSYGDNKPLGSSELSQSFAGRLEIAMILAAKGNDTIVLKDVGATAAKDKAANHLSEAAAKNLFLQKYPTAWGNDETLDAGALVIGKARIAPALDKIEFQAEAITKDGKIHPIGSSVSTPLTARTLSELGMAYRVNSENKLLVYGARGMDLALVRKNVPERVSTTSPPIAKPDEVSAVPGAKQEEALVENPIKFVILYNGKEVPVDSSGSHLKVPTPGPNDKVSFKLTNTGTQTVAVVLKINGENTFERTTCPDDQCRKWVLEPKDSHEVDGFDVNQTKQLFKVLTPSESEGQSVRYGEHAGTFRIAVFAGSYAKAVPSTVATPKEDEEGLTQIAIARGTVELPNGRPQSLTALQKDLRRSAPYMKDGRGLIVAGKVTDPTAVNVVKFVLSSKTPIVNMPIWYYEPADKKDLPKVSDE